MILPCRWLATFVIRYASYGEKPLIPQTSVSQNWCQDVLLRSANSILQRVSLLLLSTQVFAMIGFWFSIWSMNDYLSKLTHYIEEDYLDIFADKLFFKIRYAIESLSSGQWAIGLLLLLRRLIRWLEGKTASILHFWLSPILASSIECYNAVTQLRHHN